MFESSFVGEGKVLGLQDTNHCKAGSTVSFKVLAIFDPLGCSLSGTSYSHELKITEAFHMVYDGTKLAGLVSATGDGKLLYKEPYLQTATFVR